MSLFKLSKIGVLSLSTVLLLSACGQTTDEEAGVDSDTPAVEEPASDPVEETTEETTGETTEEAPAETNAPSSQGIEGREFEVSLDDAVQIFNDTFPDAEGINNVQFDVDDGRFEYEIDGFNASNNFELTLDAETGEILQQETDNDDDSETAIDFGMIISPAEAMEIALSEVGSGYVKEWDLDTDDGRTLYEIDVEGQENQDDDDVYVDAETGDFSYDD